MKLSSYKALEDYLVNFAQDDLITVVYVSDIAKKTKKDNGVFEHIRYHAAHYNKDHNVKGFLCNNERYFIQCLEGHKQVLLPLINQIFNDTRHTNIQVVLVKPIKHYHFTDWHMPSLFLDKSLIHPKVANADAEVSSHDISFEDFIPFEPHNWPSWMFEHFINTMQKFKNCEQVYPGHLIKYDTVCQDNFFLGVFLAIIVVAALALLMVTKLLY